MGVVLITGCGSGFGKLAAVEAAKRGHTVFAGLRRMTSAPALVQAAGDHDITALPLDVTSEEQRSAAVARIVAEHGRLDALVNNAGTALGGFLEDVDEDEIRTLFDVNVFGVFSLTKCCLPALRRAPSATVVMLGSMSGVLAIPGLGAYASSKFALEGLSEAWRHELAPFGIRVVVLQPAAYRTDIFGRNRRISRNAMDGNSHYAEWANALNTKAETQVERSAGDPRDVAVRICDVLESNNPRFRQPMGMASLSRTLLKRLAPFSIVERVLRQVTRPPDISATRHSTATPKNNRFEDHDHQPPR